jgi:transcriptional regulator with XRE-family HTH domain
MRRRREEREDLLDILPRRLREARIRAGLTQVEVADAAGVSEDVYARYERAERLPSIDMFRRLCRVVGCSADWLLDEDASAPPPARQHDADPAQVRRVRHISRQLRRASPDVLTLVRTVLDAIKGNQTP